MHHPAIQAPPDDAFRQTRRIDQAIQINAGFQPHLMAHENQVFRAYVPGCTAMGMATEGAAPQASH